MQLKQESAETLFVRRMRERREAEGLTQTQLASNVSKYTGTKLDATAVTRMEKGARTVRLNEAAAIASLFGIGLDEMCTPTTVAEVVGELQEARKGMVRIRALMEQAEAHYTERTEAVRDSLRRVIDDITEKSIREGRLTKADRAEIRKTVLDEVRDVLSDDPELSKELTRGL
ncbi:MAG TPA: helix-turn-helix domain-containing protein [Nocardioidaceae bacterium]|nr:helix-turn-helix domain-containing protein [Nocardioidaceae bacterium]